MFLIIFCSPPAQALEATDFWSAVRVEWGSYAGPGNVSLLEEDITCDGKPDYVGSRLNLDSPEGAWLELLVVMEGKDEAHYEALGVRYGGEGQFSLCGIPGESPRPVVTVELWSDEEILETFGADAPPLCSAAITVDDHQCDKIYYFWLPDSVAGEARFVIHRH